MSDRAASDAADAAGAAGTTGSAWSLNPLTLILLLCVAVILGSAACAALGVSAVDPRSGDRLVARSLLSGQDLRWFFSELPTTFTHFTPLGLVLIILVGASTAEHAGLMGAALRSALRRVPPRALTPAVAVIGLLAHIGSDAGYFIVIPFAGLSFAATGRNPLAGVCGAFAAIGGGYGANFLVTPTDAAVYALTEVAARTVDPSYSINILANYYLLAAFGVAVVITVSVLTDRWLEPRLDAMGLGRVAAVAADPAAAPVDDPHALRRAGWTMLALLGALLLMGLLPGGPLRADDGAMLPFYRSFPAILFVVLVAGALVYGARAGTVASQEDAYGLLTRGFADAAPFLLLMLVISVFVALLDRSGLPPIAALAAARALREAALSGPALIILFSVATAVLNLFLPSTSAKWALMAPTAVPMMMALGVSPEMATASYRIGASASELVTPAAMTPVALMFARRYAPQLGFGAFLRLMLPYTLLLLVVGVLLLSAWLFLGLPLGPTGARPYL